MVQLRLDAERLRAGRVRFLHVSSSSHHHLQLLVRLVLLRRERSRARYGEPVLAVDAQVDDDVECERRFITRRSRAEERLDR